jgi:CDP-diacylglycerol pyrophosphatase
MKISHNNNVERILNHKKYLLEQFNKSKNAHTRERLKIHISVINEMIDEQLRISKTSFN